MTTYTASNAGPLTGSGGQYSPEKVSVMKFTLDASSQNLAQNDVYNGLALPAGVTLLHCHVLESTAEGGAATVDVRCGTTVLHNDLSVNAGAGTFTGTAITPRRIPTGGEYINILANAALDAAVIEVVAVVLDTRD